MRSIVYRTNPDALVGPADDDNARATAAWNRWFEQGFENYFKLYADEIAEAIGELRAEIKALRDQNITMRIQIQTLRDEVKR